MKFHEIKMAIDTGVMKAASELRYGIERQFFLGGSWDAAPRVTAAKDVNEPTIMGGLGPKE